MAKGFYDITPSRAQRLVLIVGELSEAVEAIRKNRWLEQSDVEPWIPAYYASLRDGIPHAYEGRIKGSVEEEIADAYIRVLDYMGFKGYEKDQVAPKFRDLPSDTLEFILLLMRRAVLLDETPIMESIGLNNILFLLERFARDHNFDLHWHVEQKFLYNQSRPHKHGKSF